jgi:hypothetical protein
VSNASALAEHVSKVPPGTILLVAQRSYAQEQLERAPTIVQVIAVLVAGAVGDYAAYIGCGSPRFVASQGDKLSLDEARCYFRGLEAERYRL